MVTVLLKIAAFALYGKKKNQQLIIVLEFTLKISFQYSINILVITVKAGCFFIIIIIYEGTLRRCIFLIT